MKVTSEAVCFPAVFNVAVMTAKGVGVGRGDDERVSELSGRLGKALDLERTWGRLRLAQQPAIPEYCVERSPVALTVVASVGCICYCG